MSPAEVAKLLAVAAAAYPSLEVDDLRHRLWAEMLGDLDYELASLAVRRHISTSRFAPSIAEIREHAAAVANPGQLTGAEAWGELREAVRCYYLHNPEEALESLSPATRRVAEMIGWREIYMADATDGVLRGQFLRMFEQVQGRIAREALLPPMLQTSAQGLLGDGNNKEA